MALRRMDQFADLVSLTLNGRKRHGTRIGGSLTILLYLTLLAYWVWGTLNCFNYSQPQVFTANVPLSTGNQTNLNFTFGGGFGDLVNPEYFRYLSIVFVKIDGARPIYYNSTK